jgi:hypothetical protein
MVGGKKVLLSVAVLSGLCFDNVLGGQDTFPLNLSV